MGGSHHWFNCEVCKELVERIILEGLNSVGNYKAIHDRDRRHVLPVAMEITCHKLMLVARLCTSWTHPFCRAASRSAFSVQPDVACIFSLRYQSTTNMCAKVSEVTLNSGAKMPAFGLGWVRDIEAVGMLSKVTFSFLCGLIPQAVSSASIYCWLRVVLQDMVVGQGKSRSRGRGSSSRGIPPRGLRPHLRQRGRDRRGAKEMLQRRSLQKGGSFHHVQVMVSLYLQPFLLPYYWWSSVESCSSF